MIPEPLGGQRESRPRCESVRHRGRRRDVTINSCAVGGLYKGVLDSGVDRCGEGEWDSEIPTSMVESQCCWSVGGLMPF